MSGIGLNDALPKKKWIEQNMKVDSNVLGSQGGREESTLEKVIAYHQFSLLST